MGAFFGTSTIAASPVSYGTAAYAAPIATAAPVSYAAAPVSMAAPVSYGAAPGHTELLLCHTDLMVFQHTEGLQPAPCFDKGPVISCLRCFGFRELDFVFV